MGGRGAAGAAGACGAAAGEAAARGDPREPLCGWDQRLCGEEEEEEGARCWLREDEDGLWVGSWGYPV